MYLFVINSVYLFIFSIQRCSSSGAYSYEIISHGVKWAATESFYSAKFVKFARSQRLHDFGDFSATLSTATLFLNITTGFGKSAYNGDKIPYFDQIWYATKSMNIFYKSNK